MGRAEWRVQVFCPQDKTLAQAEFTSAEQVQPGPPRGLPRGVKTGYLARYARQVTSAARGAVLE